VCSAYTSSTSLLTFPPVPIQCLFNPCDSSFHHHDRSRPLERGPCAAFLSRAVHWGHVPLCWWENQPMLSSWATVCKTAHPMLSDCCLSCLSCPVCNVGVLWSNGFMDQDETWRGGRPWPRPHWLRWGLRSPKRGTVPPIFSQCLLWPNGWMDGSRCHLVGTHLGHHLTQCQPRRHCVRWGPSSPPQRGTASSPCSFGPCLLGPTGWMNQDATWYGGGPGLRRHCAQLIPLFFIYQFSISRLASFIGLTPSIALLYLSLTL